MIDDDPADAIEPAAKMVGGLPITRAELDRLQRPNGLRTLAVTTLLFACWGALGYAAWRTTSLAAKIGLWALAGFLVNGLVQLGHDAWHGNLFSRRWQNTLYGHLFSIPFGVSFSAARYVHLRHHWYNRTERDPDAYNAGMGWRVVLQYYVVVTLGLLLAPLHFNVLYPLVGFERRAWFAHIVELVAYAAVYVVVFSVLASHGLVSAALTIWLAPIVFATPWNGLKSVADHYRNTWKGDRFQTATTVRTTRLWSWLWNGLNYHLDHHLFPKVPGYRLGEVHAKIAPELTRRGAPVFDGYFRVFGGALREGPTYVEANVFLKSSS